MALPPANPYEDEPNSDDADSLRARARKGWMNDFELYLKEPPPPPRKVSVNEGRRSSHPTIGAARLRLPKMKQWGQICHIFVRASPHLEWKKMQKANSALKNKGIRNQNATRVLKSLNNSLFN